MSTPYTKYRNMRLREEEYRKLKELQKYIRKKGTDTINWQELRRQNIVELPDEDEDEYGDDLTLGFLLGVGAAALAYLIWKGSQKQ
ncbi:MAG TPA: hypothetical protein VGB78_09710 [Thermoplasmata archaeon]